MYKEVTHELQPRSFDLLVLPEDVVCSILKALPPEQLLSVSRVSRIFADLVDTIFQELCRQQRWTLPRFPRGQSAVTHYPWRSLYRHHACIACGKLGEFSLREQVNSHTVHLICRRCTSIPWVQQRLVKENLFVDLVGVTGKKLISNTSKRRRPSLHGLLR